MKDIKKLMITLVALLAVTTGAWADQLASSYSSNATLNAVTVSASMEVTIATGVTVTINNGLNVASGTLTVTGPGTLVVTGAKGNNGTDGEEGGPGGNGGVAISGNIIVQGGATVTANGGNGGNGGNGQFYGGTGGNGGVAFAGTLTYKSGTVTANGGSAGSGRWSEWDGDYASNGSAGKAFANDVDFTQTTGYSVTDGTSTIGSVLNQTKVVISGGIDASAPSGPEVAWDKAKNSGSFTMPGGNVTLEPEYYPQAALTAAPTAINDVPATTDGAIVSAGTVANIGETTTAQGTVMYYVSPSALDDAALLALAADKWTADVPTAADLAQGQAYVYYYVRGNDGDTDEEIFSDGDILAANAVQVTIAAEPTYAVTFADGVNPEPPAEPEWTASPAAGVTKGQTVTVTYSGSKKVIGVKAEKKAKATTPTLAEATAEDYGKVMCDKGHLHDAKNPVPDGCTAVGILGKVTGDGHGLILALQDAAQQNWNTINGWTSVDTYAGTTLKVLPAGALGSLTSYTTLGSTAVSDWAVAQKSDYDAIFTNLVSATGDSDGYTYDGNVNAYITGVGGSAISGEYWSATGFNVNYAWLFGSFSWINNVKTNSYNVRPVLGF